VKRVERRIPLRSIAAALGLGSALAGAPLTAARAAEVDCLIEPWSRITLSAAIEGVVEEVMVDRGDFVEKGQVVARLESSVERASVEVARLRARAQGEILSGEARLEYAMISLDRQKSLEERDVVSKSTMDEASSSMRVAEAQLLAAREARLEAELELERNLAVLDRRTIKSPLTGVVVDRILSPGEYADPPQILELAQIDPLRVKVFAPLALYGRIEPGMLAEVLPEAPVGGSYQAKVTVLDRVIDAASGTFGIHLELPNPDHRLPAGLNCRVRFPDEKTDEKKEGS
jgi:RND family efflux transporter MFP subunit